jgi:predicted nuclease with TOPRIM domain
MTFFKTYKVQYEEASAEVTSLKKLNEELVAKVASLEKINGDLASKSVEQLISKEDLDKLTSEHAEYINKHTELEAKLKEMESSKVDADEMASVKAEAVLATVGIDKPFVAAEDKDETDSVLKFVNGFGGRTVFKK